MKAPNLLLKSKPAKVETLPYEGVWSHLKFKELIAPQATNKEKLIKKTHQALKMAKHPGLIRWFF